mgnify:CR=1 FL=1
MPTYNAETPIDISDGYANVGYGSVTYSGGTQMAKPTDVEIEEKRAIIAEAREQALQAKADIIRVKARNKAENIRKKADGKAKMAIAKGEARAAKIEGITPAEIERKIRLDVHGRPNRRCAAGSVCDNWIPAQSGSGKN